ncbi:MAG TPA: hypothetical protein VF066_14990 [Thermoleophilaceae bacterium]
MHFAREVNQAACGLIGYSIGFAGDDHHLGLLDVRLDSEIDGDLVRVTGTLGLRDWSGNWDDDYDGVLEFAVLADLASATEPPPRADLEITGFELNQATQFFRSFQHLDGANVRPDNSIRPIARKPMGVRVYVDYDSTTGLPPITTLNGRLVVTTSIGSATLTLFPINVIAPRPDAAIDRGNSNQTLNFVIPEGWCQGELVLTCRVFDAAAPTPTSRAFQRTVRFLESEPLRCYLVGVHYTGQGLDLAAPTQAEVLTGLSFVESTYPVPEIFATGYSAIDFDTDMKADIADGCGDGFNDLLDRLRDMRGDSSDVYYAALPSGGINSGSVGGCGGGGVAATFVGGGATAAQEIGHAFNRDHAPCDDSTRCDDPADQDGNYPHYNGYPSDSIGEYGYDPATNTVFDPATSFDFMGYSGGPMWVSPYTYTGLMAAFPVSDGIPAGASASRALRAGHAPPSRPGRGLYDSEWLRRKMPTLFLGLQIDRDRRVTVRPSFSYDAPRLPRASRRTAFTVEFRDDDDAVLSCQELRNDCKHCRRCCWPQSIRDALALPDGARKLVLLEGKDVVHEQEIPDPPTVRVRCKISAKQEIVIEWSASDEEEGDLWYLVQWLDDDGTTWRGVAPRTQERAMTLPLRRFAHTGVLRFRVLAASGLATGLGECEVEPPPPPLPTVEIVPIGTWPATDRPGARLATVALVDQWGRTIPDPDIVWYDEGGSEIGRGRSLDLGALEERVSAVRAVALNVGTGRVQRTWLTRRSAEGQCTLHHHADATGEQE